MVSQEEQQEILYRLSMFEQQANALQQQLQIVDESLIEIGSLNHGLDDIKGSEGKEILAQLGRGIFVKAKMISKELTVDIGNKTFVKKSILETKEIIEQQIEKLGKIREDLMAKMEDLDRQLTRTIREAKNRESD